MCARRVDGAPLFDHEGAHCSSERNIARSDAQKLYGRAGILVSHRNLFLTSSYPDEPDKKRDS